MQEYGELLSQPTSCLDKEGGVYYCDEILFVWSLGVSPECMDGDYGIRLGKTGYSTLLLEVSILYFIILHTPYMTRIEAYT